MNLTKSNKLVIGILCDIIGMGSYLIPGAGEFFDIIWAPLSLYIMVKMYKGTEGKVAGVVSFIEEALPIEFVPTFTLMWLYTYKFKKGQ